MLHQRKNVFWRICAPGSPISGRVAHSVVPFGIPEVESHLPRGGLARGALHEVAGGGFGANYGAAAVLFAASVLRADRCHRPLVSAHAGIFSPALADAGLHPDRVLQAEARDEKTVCSGSRKACAMAALPLPLVKSRASR
jgi:protein ImuA